MCQGRPKLLVFGHIAVRQGDKTCCLPFEWRATLKGKNLLQEEEIIFFSRRSPFEKASFWEANRKLPKLLHFVKLVEKHGGAPMHLKFKAAIHHWSLLKGTIVFKFMWINTPIILLCLYDRVFPFPNNPKNLDPS